MPSISPSPKYSRPQILLLDMQPETGDTLKAAGYNVTVGSFGSPYQVDKHDGFEPVITNDDLPFHLSEQEVVVIDLLPNDPIARKWKKLEIHRLSVKICESMMIHQSYWLR